MKVDPFALKRTLAFLKEQQALGPIPGSMWKAAASGLGITREHMQRLFKTPHKRRTKFEFKEEWMIPIGKLKSIKAAWAGLRAEGALRVSYETFARAYRQQIAPAVRVGIKTEDEASMGKVTIYSRYEVEHRNDAWSADHAQLPVTVIGARNEKLHPWVTLYLDECTRFITAWAITDGTPGEEVVISTLADGLIGRDVAGTFVGGKPARIRSDRGADWIGRWMTKGLMTLGIFGDPAAPYSPHQKGKVERVIKTIQTAFCAPLPGSDLGLKGPGTRPIGGHLDD